MRDSDRLRLITDAFAAVFPDAALTPESDFFALGGDSIRAVELALALERALGKPVHPAILIHDSRIVDLAVALGSGGSAAQNS